MRRDPFRDERGMTTVGMALALLITLALVFSAARTYRVSAASSEVQNVADAAALAAQNEVAEFMIVVRTCDAVVLSLSLASLAATGLGVAALCTPATAPGSSTLLKAGRDLARAHDSFSEKASKGLDRLQRLLPFFAAANAASLAAANNSRSSKYLALALLAPSKGEPIGANGAPELGEANDAAESEADAVREAADKAQRAAEEANEAKRRAFEHDCGANPAYCMYERASSLAAMTGPENPLFKSVDTWSFSVALERARAYYPQRAALEKPQDDSVAEKARSALRARFYDFAADELGRGYVHEGDDAFDAFFPHLPKNTEEMRSTPLYTEAAYPCTDDGEGRRVMHAWAGCPNAGGAESLGSIAQMEEGSYALCPECEFSASSMGKVAAASSSIDNGFEFHYEAVAAAADDYVQARSRLDPLTAQVKQQAGGLLDKVKQAFGKVANGRIDARPPGRLGVVALVANTGGLASSDGFEASFVKDSGALGMRAAVSAATLVPEPSDEGATVVSSLLDGIKQSGGAPVGVLGVVMDCWSGLLQAYAQGQRCLDEAVSSALDLLPLGSASGLGAWASKALRSVMKAAGLEPAKLDALKPVLVNSAHVASRDDGAVSARLLSLKKQAIEHPLSSNELFPSVLDAVEQETIDVIQSSDAGFEIASIELLGKGGPSIALRIALPEVLKDTASDVVHAMVEGLRGVIAQVTGVRIWQ